MGRLLNALSVGGGILGLALVAVLYLQPDLVFGLAPGVARQVAGLDPSVVLLAVVGLLIVLALGKLTVGHFLRGVERDASTGRTHSTSRSLYGHESDDLDALGEAVDDMLALATAYESVNEAERRDARDAILHRLRTTAATAYAQSTGLSGTDAEAAVAAGEWTDDRRAAGLLSADDGPSIPVHLWLFDLLLGRDPFAEALDRSLAAIAALNGDEVAATPERPARGSVGVVDR